MIDSVQKSNYSIHLIYAGSFIVAVFMFIGYMAWNNHQIALQKENEQIRKIKVLGCIQYAEKSYAQSWANACKQNAEKTQEALSSCENQADSLNKYLNVPEVKEKKRGSYLYNYEVAQCRRAYGAPNPRPDCELPGSIAESLNISLQRQEKLCNEMVV